jgi:cobalamin biosynthesis protein CbiM
VGPYAASLALTVVLGIQALLFADGGLSAIGLNILNMSILGVAASYLIFNLAKKLLPKIRTSIPLAAGIAAFISVPVAAMGFALQYAVGGTGTAPASTVATAMLSTHILIGLGEAIITMLTVSAIMATRSDLVYGWKSSKIELMVK